MADAATASEDARCMKRCSRCRNCLYSYAIACQPCSTYRCCLPRFFLHQRPTARTARRQPALNSSDQSDSPDSWFVRLHRRIANRESARQVRQKHRESLEEAQDRLDALSQQLTALQVRQQQMLMCSSLTSAGLPTYRLWLLLCLCSGRGSCAVPERGVLLAHAATSSWHLYMPTFERLRSIGNSVLAHKSAAACRLTNLQNMHGVTKKSVQMPDRGKPLLDMPLTRHVPACRRRRKQQSCRMCRCSRSFMSCRQGARGLALKRRLSLPYAEATMKSNF